MFANTVVVSLLALLQLPQLILVNIPIFIAIEKRFPITVVEVPRPTKDGLILIHPGEDIAAKATNLQSIMNCWFKSSCATSSSLYGARYSW